MKTRGKGNVDGKTSIKEQSSPSSSKRTKSPSSSRRSKSPVVSVQRSSSPKPSRIMKKTRYYYDHYQFIKSL